MDFRSLVRILCHTSCVLLIVSSAFGQAAGLQAKQAAVDEDEVKIFQLQYLNPDDAVAVLTRLFGPGSKETAPGKTPKFAPEPRTRSLVAKGEGDALRVIEALLLRLDEKGNRSNLVKAQIFSLQHAAPDTVALALERSGLCTSVHPDSRTRSVLVNMPQDTTDRDQVSALIRSLDRPMVSEVKDISIRIVWLVDSSLTKEKAEAVPADLNPLIEALRKKVGLGELRTAAQLIVRTAPGEAHSSLGSGTARLDVPFSFSFQGQIKQTADDRYGVQLQGTIRKSGEETIYGELNTNCASVRIGQPVIIGTTSIDSRPSVFVIQLLDD